MIVRNGKNARSIATHTQDYFTDLGYDYRNHIYEKTVSPEILKNQNTKNILLSVDKMIVFLIDAVKQIKLQYLISLDKNDRNVN